MDIIDKLYDVHEQVKVRFLGITTEDTRYDFGIVYTNQFFGKPLVICMQTGRTVLLDPKDLENIEYIQAAFKIVDEKQASDLVEFFRSILPAMPFEPQYE